MATRAPRDVGEELARELEGPAQILPPQVQSLGIGTGAYVVRFPAAMARITVESIRMGRDGLRGEVMVEVGPFGDGDYRIVGGPGRMELNSMSQRETWERRLRKRWAGTDWEQVMDRFCAAILQAEKRLDKPAIKLRDAVRPASTDMLIRPLVAESGLPTLWWGDGGSAKSLLAMAAALSLHENLPIIGSFRPANKMRVLYVDFELDEWPHHDRMRKLLAYDGPAGGLPDLDYLDCKGGTIVNQIERIQAAARDCHAEFIVIDSVSYAAEGPLNDDETARLYYQKVASIGLPSLSLAHVPKNAGNPDYPFGSVHWKNLARLGWYFQVCEGGDDDKLLLKLTNKKHNLGTTPKPIGLSIYFTPHSIQISYASADDLEAPEQEKWKQIQQVLRREGHAMTYTALALATGLDERVVRARVSEKKEAFVVLDEKPKRVGLAAPRGVES